MLLHLPVGKGHDSLRHQLLQRGRHISYIVDPVIHIINLAAPGQLPDNGLPYHLLIILTYKRLDRQPVVGRLLQHAHIPDAHQRHMEGSGDRRRRQRQHIHIVLDFLDFFLVGHPETLFLIDDQKPQILELDIRRKDAVRPDNNIHLPFPQILHRFFLLRRRPETGHQINPHREILHSLDKGIIMLLGKDRGRH